MASPISSLDLNLLPSPKIEPKPEPLEPNSNIGPMPQILNPNSLSIVPFTDPSTPLQHLSPAAADEEALFAEYYRLAHLFMASYSSPNSHANPLATAPPPSPSPSPSSALIVSKKRKARSAEMVRVSSLSEQDQIYFRDLVRRTRITFESLRVLIIRDEARGEGLGAFGKRSRADLKTAALMTDRGLWLNRDKRIIGSIPGIFVGDVYFFRMELCVIGLHGQVQAGIDYVPASRSSSGEPIATSIIVSGGYEDDDDGGDVLIYTGHGGRDRNLHKMRDGQKLEGGNLALERSMRYGIEIRVIRGVKFDQSPTGKLYVYDGLYKVVDCWMDAGKSGFGVYKYKLLRIEGQEEMGSSILKLSLSLKMNPLSVRKSGVFCDDISMGKETFPVSLYNDLDDDQDPLQFEYLVRPIYPPDIQGKFNGEANAGCECRTNCSANCYCATLNGGEFAYGGSGVLLRGKPLIYECGAACQCPPSCPNRVSQKGIKHQLEVFRSNETGWGVRSLDLIRAGTFICEFTGIVLTKQQTDLLSQAGESLVFPNRFPGRWAEWGDISDVFSDYLPPRYPYLPELSFSIDVSRARNIACYLSHSCSPNVFLQFVLYDHYNVSYPHLMIFAMENIPPLRELSIDYGVVEEWVGKLTL
ncbi:histone-lysine N-methyltransferase family member SUVH9 [Dendrobium catenatum]|uniref:Putative histone-lysine N-methyltransferase, H3 lysine-9 specific SUVH9 n=1 Tax=Dendrobium catenatum TaxID=906689 RepID=A0A2I0VTU2_9ASPA|nr:histone-lysine N-methyltransferase family member SUVH9 [Dendrobium catenatum]PKU66832.1 putative histone-lysine N-methyltransferase, H3 lysine-9 specific SUVH9 [Dendrobium catenatum]